MVVRVMARLAIEKDYCIECGHYYDVDLNTGTKLTCDCKCHELME